MHYYNFVNSEQNLLNSHHVITTISEITVAPMVIENLEIWDHFKLWFPDLEKSQELMKWKEKEKFHQKFCFYFLIKIINILLARNWY